MSKVSTFSPTILGYMEARFAAAAICGPTGIPYDAFMNRNCLFICRLFVTCPGHRFSIFLGTRPSMRPRSSGVFMGFSTPRGARGEQCLLFHVGADRAGGHSLNLPMHTMDWAKMVPWMVKSFISHSNLGVKHGFRRKNVAREDVQFFLLIL